MAVFKKAVCMKVFLKTAFARFLSDGVLSFVLEERRVLAAVFKNSVCKVSV